MNHKHKHLCLIFGIVPDVCSKVIRTMLRLAVRRLADNPIAEMRFPSAEKMRQFSGMVQSREPLVDDVIGFMDGVSIPAECTDKRFEQNTSIVVMTKILWSITSSRMVLMEKYFLRR